MTDVTHKYSGVTTGGRLIVSAIIILTISNIIQWAIIALVIAWYIGKSGAV
jgi:hypothetical protein